MKGFVQQLLLYALIEGKHAGRYDLNRIRSPAVAIDPVSYTHLWYICGVRED